MEKLEILLIHQHYASPSGTAPTRTHRIALEFVEQGHSVTIFCGNYDRSGQIDQSLPYKVVKSGVGYSSNSGFASRLISFFRFTFDACVFALRKNWDHLYCTSTPLSVWIPGYLSAKIKKTPWTAEERDLWPEVPFAYGLISKPLWWITLSLKKRFLHSASKIIVVTLPMLRYYTRAYDLKAAHIEIKPNFQIYSDTVELPDCSEAKKFVYAGSLGWVTATNELVSMAKALKNRNMGESIDVFGEGFYFETLKDSEKELFPFLRVFPPVKNENLEETLKNYEVGIVHFRPNKWFSESGSPNKIKSYQDAGLCVWSNIPIWGLKSVSCVLDEFRAE